MKPALHDPICRVGTSSSRSPVLDIPALVELCMSPYGLEKYSPLLAHKYLLLNLDGATKYSDLASLAHVVERLRLVPCPVIGIGSAASESLLKGVDVVVDCLRDTEVLIRSITEHPLAAMTLVQLLRHNEDVGPLQGLLAESFAYASLQGGVEFAAKLKPPGILETAACESAGAVTIERKNQQLLITLNRPHARNAYSVAMRDGLHEALNLLKSDDSLQRAVIRGEGSCFCIGGDLSEFGQVSDVSTAHAIRSSRSVGQLLLELSGKLEFRLHRACIGAGIELPAFAARVVASKNTFMQLPEIKLGLLPGAGGTVSISRRIGRHRTAFLALSGRKINASTALKWGLIDAIV